MTQVRETLGKRRNGSRRPPIIEEGSIHLAFDYPVVGAKESYLLYHEDSNPSSLNIKGLKTGTFWMTFSENYLTHLKVLKNVGMTRIDEVDYEGHKVVPIKFLKALLPEPTSLGTKYTGKTVIGNIMTGKKNGRRLTRYVYNVCDHERLTWRPGPRQSPTPPAYPAMIGAMMLLSGEWPGRASTTSSSWTPIGSWRPSTSTAFRGR